MIQNIQNLLLDFIGTYNPVMSDVYDSAGNYVGQTVASGAAGVDWYFIAAAAVFIILIYSFFRVLGGLINGIIR